MNELEAKRAMATCQHFNGVMNPTCSAGLAYPKGQALPCIAPFSPNLTQPRCPKYLATTLEQVEKQEAEYEKASKNVTLAREAIIKATGGKRRVSGNMPCPVCNLQTGDLRYHVAYNGHVHACCTTDGCVRWME